MSVELLYRIGIVQLTRIMGFVKMVLEPVRRVSPEEVERVRLESELESETDVEFAAEQIQKMSPPEPKNEMEGLFFAMQKYFPGIFEAASVVPPSRGHSVSGSSPVRVSQVVEMWFTIEQYSNLGEPPLLGILKLSINMEHGG